MAIFKLNQQLLDTMSDMEIRIAGFKLVQGVGWVAMPGKLTLMHVPNFDDMKGMLKGMDRSIPVEKEKY